MLGVRDSLAMLYNKQTCSCAGVYFYSSSCSLVCFRPGIVIKNHDKELK